MSANVPMNYQPLAGREDRCHCGGRKSAQKAACWDCSMFCCWTAEECVVNPQRPAK